MMDVLQKALNAKLAPSTKIDVRGLKANIEYPIDSGRVRISAVTDGALVAARDRMRAALYPRSGKLARISKFGTATYYAREWLLLLEKVVVARERALLCFQYVKQHDARFPLAEQEMWRAIVEWANLRDSMRLVFKKYRVAKKADCKKKKAKPRARR